MGSTVVWNRLFYMGSIVYACAASDDNFRLLMRPLQESIPSLPSYLELFDRSRQKSAETSSGRRRTVTDLDCEGATGDVDSIESICHAYRYNVLSSLVPDMTEIRKENSSITDVFKSLYPDFYTANSTSTDPGSIMKDMYQLRMVTFGGMDPDTKKPEPGLIKRAYTGTQELIDLHRLTEASLDTVWSNIDITQTAVAERLYNQVFLVATATEKFLQDLHNKSQKIMTMYSGNLVSDIAEVNNQLLNISSTICSTQDQINKGGKELIEDVDHLLPSLSDKTDALVDQYEAVIEKFKDLNGESDNVIDNMETKSESIASFGLGSVEASIEKFANTFSESLETFLDRFFVSQKDQADIGFGIMSNIAINKTNDLLDSIETRKTLSQKNRQNFAEQIDRLKSSVSLQIANVSKAQSDQLGSASSTIASIGANAALYADAFSSSKRELDTKLDSLETVVNSTLSNTAGELADSIQKASQEAQNGFNAGINSLSSLKDKFATSIGQQFLLSQSSVARSDDSAATSLFQSSSDIGDQVKLLSTNNLLSDANLGLLGDQTTGLIKSQLGPLYNQIGLLGNEAVGLAADISASQKSAKTDVTRLRSVWDETDIDAILAASSDIDESISRTRLSLEDKMNTSISRADSASANLTSSLSSLTQSQSDLYGVQSKLTPPGSPLTQVASSLYDVDSLTSNRFGSKMNDAMKMAKLGMSDGSTKIENSLNTKQGQVNTKLSSIMSKLAGNIAQGGGEFGDSGMSRETLATIAEIESGMANLTNTQEAIGQKMKTSMEDYSRSVESKFPAEMKLSRTKLKALIDRLHEKMTSGMKLFSQVFDSRVRGIMTQWDMDKLEHDLGIDITNLKDEIVPIEAVLNDTIGGFLSAIPEIYGPFADETSEVVAEEGLKMNNSLREDEADLRERIANFTDSFNKRIRLILSAADDAMNHASDSWSNASIALENIKSVDAIGSAKVLDIQSGSNEAMSSILSTIESVVNRSKRAESPAVDIPDLTNLTSNWTNIERESELSRQNSKSVLSDSFASAQNIANQVDFAATKSFGNVKSILTQESEQAQFGLDSSQGTLGRLSGMSETTVGSTLDIENDTKVAIGSILNDVHQSNEDQKSTMADLDKKISIMSDSISHTVNSTFGQSENDVSATSQLYTLQMEQVKKFIRNTYQAFNRYMDYEGLKFDKMANNDKVSLQYLENAVVNGIGAGEDLINSTDVRLVNLTAMLKEEELKLREFKNDTDLQIGKVEETNGKIVNDTTKESTEISDLITSTNKTAIEAWKTSNSSIASILQSFYAGLDRIESQTLAD